MSAAWQGRIFVVGGTNWIEGHKRWLAGVHVYNPAAQRWETLPSLGEPLAHALVGSTDSGLLVAGGTTGRAPSQALRSLEAGPRFVESARRLTTPAVVAAGGLVGAELIVVGGTDDVANVAGFRRDAFAWNVHTGAQRTLPVYPGRPLGIAASAVVGDEVFVFGGASWIAAEAKVVNLADAYAFSVGRNAWRRLRSLPRGGRALAAVPLDANRIYLAGGVQDGTEGFSAQAVIYHLAEDQYTAAVPLPYRAYVALVLCDGFVYCLGGEDQARQRTDLVYRISVAALLK